MRPNVWVLPLEAMLEILKEFSTWRPRLKSHDFFTSQQFKTSFWKDICQNNPILTPIDFVKYSRKTTLSWKLFRKIIWNRDIIMLIVRLIDLDEKFKTKYVLLNFKVFEKIKQVSSTKLTNWYKNISLWKTNRFFHRLIFLNAKLKVSKILLQSLRASFRKTKKLFSREKSEVQNTGT